MGKRSVVELVEQKERSLAALTVAVKENATAVRWVDTMAPKTVVG